MEKVVARVTRYFANNDEQIVEISDDDPVWVMGNPLDTVIEDYDIRDEQVLIMSDAVRAALIDTEGSDEIVLMGPDDHWELVPPNDWPDEVSQVFAEKMLQGED